MLLHSSGDGRLVAPSDQSVDQPVAAAIGNVVVGEAETQPVARVVRQGEVALHVCPGDRPRLLRILFQHHALLRGDQRAGPQRLPSDARMLRRDQIRVGAGSARGSQFEHLRAQRGQGSVLRRDWYSGGVQRVEERTGPLQWVLVRAGRDGAVDARRVAYPDAQQEPRAVPGGQRGVFRGRFLGGVQPQIEDAGGGDCCRGRPEKVAEGPEHAPADVRDPHCRVAQRLELRRRSCDLGWVAVAQGTGPYTRATKGMSHGRQPATNCVHIPRRTKPRYPSTNPAEISARACSPARAIGWPSTLRTSIERCRPSLTSVAKASAQPSSVASANVTRFDERRSNQTSGSPLRKTTIAPPIRLGRPGDCGQSSAAPYGCAGSVAARITGAGASSGCSVGSGTSRADRRRSTAPGRANWAAPRPETK